MAEDASRDSLQNRVIFGIGSRLPDDPFERRTLGRALVLIVILLVVAVPCALVGANFGPLADVGFSTTVTFLLILLGTFVGLLLVVVVPNLRRDDGR